MTVSTMDQGNSSFKILGEERDGGCVAFDISKGMQCNASTILDDGSIISVLGVQTIGCSYLPNVFFMSCLLFIGTFLIAKYLKQFKNQRFFTNIVRSYISDFAVIIAIFIMVIIDLLFNVETPKLAVPNSFSPTWEERGWLIHPFGSNPWWTALVAPIPAMLGCILIF